MRLGVVIVLGAVACTGGSGPLPSQDGGGLPSSSSSSSSSSSGSPPADEAGSRICTPGAYVYCRCPDRSEATKQCNEDGTAFGACGPCGDAGDVDAG